MIPDTKRYENVFVCWRSPQCRGLRRNFLDPVTLNREVTSSDRCENKCKARVQNSSPFDSENLASACFIISKARLPGVQIGEGLRWAHRQRLAGVTVEELLTTRTQASQTTPKDFSFFKNFNGVSWSEKLLYGSQVLSDGG